MHYLNEENIFLFLIQIFLLLGLARGLAELLKKWKQPALTAEILAGILLGPTIFGRFLPAFHQSIFPPDAAQQNMLETVAWLGVLLLLLEIGLEFDFSSGWRQRGDALKIAVTDIVVPIMISFAACLFLPDRYLMHPNQRIIFALFMAAAMTMSSTPTTARTLHDLRLTKTDLGFLIVSALSVNDVIGWLIFSLALSLLAQATLNIGGTVAVMALTVGFTFVCLTAGRSFANLVLSRIRAGQISQVANSLTFICLLGLLCGAITQKIGIHALFGFFIAGVMAGGAKALSERTRQVISQMVFAVFVPLFFASIGLKIDFFKSFDLFIALFITVISMTGKFWGAWLGVGLTNVPRTNRLPIAIAHTSGGMTEIVVGLLAFQHRLISEPVFIGIVFGAVVSSVVLGPWLSHSIKKRKAVSILEFFSSGTIAADLKNADRDKAIEELCRIAAEQEDMADFETLYTAVLKRENAMGTAMEEGVAVPHARLSFLKRPVIVFGRSLAGIEWDSPDGKPTHFIFLIFTPERDDVQVQILALIARAMSQEENRDDIMQAEGPYEVWQSLQMMFTSQHIVRK
jgi:Kef-type K+ transport system membrane component KefB